MRPASIRSCRIREKCSGVTLSRDATVAFDVGSLTTYASFASPLVGVLAQQESDDALRPRLQRIGFDVVDEPVQPAGQAREHLAGELRLALQLVEHHGLRHVQQERVGERLRHHDVRLLHEHQRFAERAARADDLDDLLAPVRRRECELDLAIDDEMEADAGVEAIEDDSPARDVDLRGARRNGIELRRVELLEQRQAREERLRLDAGSGHGIGSGGSMRRRHRVRILPGDSPECGVRITIPPERLPEERVMPVTELNHYFVRANDLEATKQFYCDVLGFEVMPRPAFPFPGYWLGTNGKIQVHMGPHGIPNAEMYYLGTTPQSSTANSGVVDHIAFLATDPDAFKKRCDARGIACRNRYFREFELYQMFVQDPNNLTIELNFPGHQGRAEVGRRELRGDAARHISTMTSPDTGSVTPSPPPRSSSVSRNVSSMAIIFGRAATRLWKLSHSPTTQ